MTLTTKLALSSALVGALMMGSVAQAAPVTIDLKTGGSYSDSVGKNGYGNSITFVESGVTAVASGYGQTNYPYLETAEISRWSTGLGVCNQSEGTVNGPLWDRCSTSASIFGSDEHQVDSNGADDYIVLTFTTAVTMSSAVIDPYGFYDRDVKFWIGSVDLGTFDLDGVAENDISLISGMGSAVTKTASASSAPLSVGLDGAIGNVLILKGLTSNDYFKFASITVEAVVPVPAAAWLFGSAVLGLLGSRKMAGSKKS